MQVIRKFNPEGVTLSNLYKKCLVVSIDESISEYFAEQDNGGESNEEDKESD